MTGKTCLNKIDPVHTLDVALSDVKFEEMVEQCLNEELDNEESRDNDNASRVSKTPE